MPLSDLVDFYESRIGTDARVEQYSSPSRRNAGASAISQQISRTNQPRTGLPLTRTIHPHPLLRRALPNSHDQAMDVPPVEGLPKLSGFSQPMSNDSDVTTSPSVLEADITSTTTSTTLHDHLLLPQCSVSQPPEEILPPNVTEVDTAKTSTKRRMQTIPSHDFREEELFSKAISDNVTAGKEDQQSLFRQRSLFVADSMKFPESPSHEPVAASVIFSRGAAPLFFPELDRHLSGIAAPSFAAFTAKLDASRGNTPSMFPPMQLLAASGHTLEDLEHNSQIPQWWKNRNKISGFLVSALLSVTVRKQSPLSCNWVA